MSCSPSKKFADEISQIETYENKLDSIEQIFNGIEFDSLQYMYEKALDNEKQIKRYYWSDTIDMDFAKKMDANKGIKKSLKNLQKKKEEFESEIIALKNQFSALKEDILNGLYTKEQINQYLTKEIADFDNLSFNFDSFNINQAGQKKYFYWSNPDLTNYIENSMDEVVVP